MSSFQEFLNLQLDREVSKDGQINQYRRSLKDLSKVRERLASSGISTQDMDGQIDQIRQAMERRSSGTHKWHGDIVRIDQESIDSVPMWKLTTRSDLVFHIPAKSTTGVIKIPVNWHQFPSANKPMTKLIEYREALFGYNVVNLITYAENRTVDIVPFRNTGDTSQYYLIKRGDSGLWATVGGHIDEGELHAPIMAARRELKEETKAEPLVIRQLPSGWIKESVTNSDHNPAKEYNSWTLPFIAIISPTFVMEPSDDAASGEWFGVDHVPDVLHFSHHKKILKKAFEFLPTLLKQFGKH